MKKLKLYDGYRAGLAACLALSAMAHARENLDSYLEGVRAKYGSPALAAAVTKDGKIIAAGAVGKRVMGMDISVTINDRFHLGSDTKAMTATVAGTLVEEGGSADEHGGRGAWQEDPGHEPGTRGRHSGAAPSHSSGIPTDTPR